MLNTIQSKSNQVGGTVAAASRQVWLASLGAAVVTRDWAEREAGTVLRTLVKEGTAVESKAFRLVGDRVETSMTRANKLWKKTRATVETTMRAYADTAVAIVRQSLPKSLPKVDVSSLLKSAPAPKPVRARRVVKTHATKTRAAKPKATKVVKRAKRAAKGAKR
jgi:hypothetical protein